MSRTVPQESWDHWQMKQFGAMREIRWKSKPKDQKVARRSQVDVNKSTETLSKSHTRSPFDDDIRQMRCENI